MKVSKKIIVINRKERVFQVKEKVWREEGNLFRKSMYKVATNYRVAAFFYLKVDYWKREKATSIEWMMTWDEEENNQN